MTAKQTQINNSITAKQPQSPIQSPQNSHKPEGWIHAINIWNRDGRIQKDYSETEMLDHQLPQLITKANPNPIAVASMEISTPQPALHGTKRNNHSLHQVIST